MRLTDIRKLEVGSVIYLMDYWSERTPRKLIGIVIDVIQYANQRDAKEYCVLWGNLHCVRSYYEFYEFKGSDWGVEVL